MKLRLPASLIQNINQDSFGYFLDYAITPGVGVYTFLLFIQQVTE